MDHAHRRRAKIWGEARIAELEAELASSKRRVSAAIGSR
jgi:hypothetical protein